MMGKRQRTNIFQTTNQSINKLITSSWYIMMSYSWYQIHSWYPVSDPSWYQNLHRLMRFLVWTSTCDPLICPKALQPCSTFLDGDSTVEKVCTGKPWGPKKNNRKTIGKPRNTIGICELTQKMWEWMRFIADLCLGKLMNIIIIVGLIID